MQVTYGLDMPVPTVFAGERCARCRKPLRVEDGDTFSADPDQCRTCAPGGTPLELTPTRRKP